MRFDTALKKSFAIVVGFLLGVAAYFQASGIGSLVAGALAVDPSTGLASRSALLGPLRPLPPALSDHATSALAILERNPFDSVTGPLTGGDGVPPIDRGAQPPVDSDRPCEGARVVLISSSDEPDWSFAAIASDNQKPILRRVGDEIAGFSVSSIERDHVWLVSKDVRCRADLGAPPPKVAAHKEPPPPPRPGGLPPDIAAGIKKVAENEYTVERPALDAILARQGELFGKLRIWPDKDGFRLGGVPQDSVLGAIGLVTGDKLQRINGFELNDPKSALEAYTKLMAADHLTVAIVRAGKPMNIDLKIR